MIEMPVRQNDKVCLGQRCPIDWVFKVWVDIDSQVVDLKLDGAMAQICQAQFGSPYKAA